MTTKINTLRQREHQQQVALFQFLATIEDKHPGIKVIYAIPNGGHRHVAVAVHLKAEGVKPGVPDICVPVRSFEKGYGALYIEMKAPEDKLLKLRKGELRPNQREWMERLQAEGNLAVVCYTWEEAAREILHYLNITSVKIQ